MKKVFLLLILISLNSSFMYANSPIKFESFISQKDDIVKSNIPTYYANDNGTWSKGITISIYKDQWGSIYAIYITPMGGTKKLSLMAARNDFDYCVYYDGTMYYFNFQLR